MDPLERPPQEVISAAQLLHNYFIQQGIEHWELMDTCSRTFAYTLDEIRSELKQLAMEKDEQP